MLQPASRNRFISRWTLLDRTKICPCTGLAPKGPVSSPPAGAFPVAKAPACPAQRAPHAPLPAEYHASQFSFQGPQTPKCPASSQDVRFNQLVDQLSPPAPAPEGDMGSVLAHMSAEYQARRAASPPSQNLFPPSPSPAPSKGQLTLPELWRTINQQLDDANGQTAAVQASPDSSKESCSPARNRRSRRPKLSGSTTSPGSP